ncbi:MAG: CDP-glycerol glycerophosphotransferase family protein [Planctomycetaceae bacterium]|jgi:YidC/Oxa1 family membrane protein insertase|nr:CDP-glycerol glycerophosphotransferase family protein [Planctomycetaceae bacterium]
MKKPSFWTCWKGYSAFQKLSPEQRRIVFYSEGKSYWSFLRPVINALLETTNETPTYISSDPDDPGLTFATERMRGVCVGSGFMMIMLFNSLKANVLAMSTPDLEVYHLKRSKVFPVHYAYLMHGADSVSMVLRERALDHFDSVFCSGMHNVTEIRKRETMKALPKKQLFEIGYPYQDELIAKVNAETAAVTAKRNGDKLCVLVAPSYSEKGTGTLETCGVELVGSLLDAGYETIVRPHPRTWLLQPKCIETIRQTYSERANFTLETSTVSSDSLRRADLLISDWSAIALEYAFSRLRPVLYIDVPRKVINPNYAELGIEPFEVSVREKVGAVLPPDEVGDVANVVRKLCENPTAMSEQIRNVRDTNVFNVGKSAIKAAEKLVELANRKIT